MRPLLMRRIRHTKQIVQVRDLFDEWAQNGRADGMERGHAPVARQAFDALALKPGQRYLDIGCGNGYSVRWAARLAASVEAQGIDLSAQMITLARQMTSGLPNARFRRVSFPMAASLAPEPFHAIFSMEVFYYLPDLPGALEAVRTLLVPGGRFGCVVDYYQENQASHVWPQEVGVSMNLLSADAWRQAFADAGLAVVRQERLFPPLLPGEAKTWKHVEGSLFTLGERPA